MVSRFCKFLVNNAGLQKPMISSAMPGRPWICVSVLILAIGSAIALGTAVFNSNPSVIPQSPPRERNRIHTSFGHSMVVPDGWTDNGGRIINSFSATPKSSSYPIGWFQTFVYGEREGSALAQNYAPATFKQMKAFEQTQTKPGSSLFDHDTHQYSILFKRKAQWFRIVYRCNRPVEPFPPKIVMEYFKTFRVE